MKDRLASVSRRVVGHAAALFAALLALSAVNVSTADVRPARQVRYVMGTHLDITVYAPSGKAGDELLEEAFSIAQALERVLSNYDQESEISRYNRLEPGQSIEPSKDLRRVLVEGEELRKRTKGAFDIRIRPLVELWSKEGRAPSTDEISFARRCLVETQIWDAQKIKKSCIPLAIETGGIGKGYAVDRIADYLIASGVESALVQFGRSSTRAIGKPPGTEYWKLTVKFSDDVPAGTVWLQDGALSGSDTHGRIMVRGGVARGHIIDPKKGVPVGTRSQSLVLSRTATEGEALSKVVLLNGLPDGHTAQALGILGAVRIRNGKRERVGTIRFE